MNKLLNIMAADMGITSYINEPEEMYAYRIIYSALGLWCLKSALGSTGEKDGVSKNTQSILLHNLSEKYIQLVPAIRDMLRGTNRDIAVFIRNIYEQTGYLLTLENNYNILNSGMETVQASESDYIFLGIPDEKYTVNGLGIHSISGQNQVLLNDFLIRDNLTPEEYVEVNYNECDFEKRDIDTSELEFFDAKSSKALSKSWSTRITTDITIARKGQSGPYYRVMFNDNRELVYVEENTDYDSHDKMIGAEFRRLYIALRHHYERPMSVFVCPIDEEYTHISIKGGRIPNREYYYLLLNGWPKSGIEDRYNFIVRNELVTQCAEILNKLGFEIRNGVFYG